MSAKATPEYNLAVCNPDLAAEWHPTKNEYKPTDLTQSSQKVVWWKCSDCSHEWRSVIKRRNYGSGCPACAGQVATSRRNLQIEHPDLAAEWHPTKNGKLKPTDVLSQSNKKVWWKCSKCPYEWIAPVQRRGGQGSGCPACAGRVATSWNNLAVLKPELVEDWHPTKNDFKPTDVTPGSVKKVWWKCSKCPHEWQTAVYGRSGGSGCPSCSGREVTFWNNLAALKPVLAAQWHPAKNGKLRPTDVTAGSGKKVWWKCSECSYEWRTIIASRSSGGGCPSCLNLVATSRNNLAVLNPELAAEWHPTKNGKLKPTDVTLGRRAKVWWKCPQCPHEWQAAIHSRASGCGCPACARQVVTPWNNLAVEHPELAAQWHPTKNGDLKPTEILAGGKRRFWWKCSKCPHEWESAIGNRKIGQGCPACSNKVATPWNNLPALNPDLAAEWHPTKNGKLRPMDVTPGSHKEVWWKCSDCSYEWALKVAYRLKHNSCPACSNRVVTPDNNFAALNPDLAAEWHPTKNGDLKPTDVLPQSNRRAWWRCSKGHEWETQISARLGCPYCSGRCASPDNNLAVLNPELAAEWHPTKNDFKPTDVTPGSDKKVWWKCSKCPHEWESAIGNRNMGQGCPACSGRKAVPWRNFATEHPELVKEWHPANEFEPTEVTPGSGRKAWWRCHKCSHEWQAQIVSRHQGRSSCLACKGRVKPSKKITASLWQIWSRKLWPYESSGKVEVCEMIQTELDQLGYSDLNFLSLPGNGREIRQLLDEGFDFNYDDCLGVEKKKAMALREFFKRLFVRGEMGGIMPIIRDDIDDVLLDGRPLPEFNAIHLDYNGPLTMKHLLATEAALRKNPDAVVAVTVQSRNAHGLRMDYKQGDFPFITVNPELLFFQPYAGVNGCPMETYCFIGDAS